MPRITVARIEQFARESMFGMSDPGVCLACGAERDGCEPDARGYECYDCGEHEVVGAQEALMMLW